MPHYMQKLRCSKCGKGLWKKNARLIDGVILCSACMFGQRDRGSKPVRAETGTGSVHESPGARSAIAQPLSQPFQPHPKDSSPCP